MLCCCISIDDIIFNLVHYSALCRIVLHLSDVRNADVILFLPIRHHFNAHPLVLFERQF